ncbi:MAG: sulfotransferase family protein [Terriglobales bacterium]
MRQKLGLVHELPWIASCKKIGARLLGNGGNAAALEPPPALPSFFVIGPPRTGSTWLHEALRKHALLPSLTKETRFFDNHFHRGFDWYRAHYQGIGRCQLIGEVAPTYFASPLARDRIARAIPQARVICVFRDPVERLLSLYRLKCAYGLIRWNFEQAIVHDPELLESGKYATNLKAWQRTLGAKQVSVAIYDDLRNSPQSFLDGVVDFIGMPRFALTPSLITRVNASDTMTHPRNYYRTRSALAAADWCKARRLDLAVTTVKNSPLIKLFLGGGPNFAELSREASLRLYEHFLPEVEELEALLNRDFSLWKPATVQAV